MVDNHEYPAIGETLIDPNNGSEAIVTGYGAAKDGRRIHVKITKAKTYHKVDQNYVWKNPLFAEAE